MSCRYTYKGKTYEAHEFDDVLRAMSPSEASKFMPSVDAVPDAPFTKSTDAWVALALKRVIKMAVDEGYDKVAFINGEQSADRYDLSKQIERVRWFDAGTKRRSEFKLDAPDGRGTLMAYAPNGTLVVDKNIDASQLEDYVGKEVAQRLLEAPGAYKDMGDGNPPSGHMRMRELSGVQLKVGGEGMKAFYDKIVPSVLKDVLRKVGGGTLTSIDIGATRGENDLKFGMGAFNAANARIVERAPGVLQVWVKNERGVEQVRGGNFKTKTEAEAYIASMQPGAQQPGFDITPTIREKAAGGLPMFAQGRPTSAPSTVQSVRSEIATLFTGDTSGAITVLANADGLPPSIREKFKKAGGIAVTTDRDHVYLVADRIERGTVRAVVMHELGVHVGLQKADVDRFTRQIREWAKGTGRLADMAKYALRAGQSSSSTNASDESVAYMIQFLVDAGWTPKTAPHIMTRGLLNRIINAIKAALESLGLSVREITPQDMVNYTYGAAKMALQRRQQAGVTTDPAAPDIRFSLADNLGAGQPDPPGKAISKQTVTDILKRAGNKLADYRGLALQGLGRMQLVNLYGKDIPALIHYSGLVQQMDADVNGSGAEADALATAWGKLADEKQLAEVMHDATLLGIDPTKAFSEGTAAPGRTAPTALQHRRLVGRYEALSPEAKKVFTDARDQYAAHWAAVQKEMKARIERSMEASPGRAELLAKMATAFKESEGIYFPLARFGDYVIVAKDADGAVLMATRAETLNEAAARRAEMVKHFADQPGVTVSKVFKSKEFNANRDMVSKGFLKELFDTLEKQDVPADVFDSINQLYLASLPDLSWAKHGIHRKGTPGFSQDARRAFAMHMFHGARYLSKLRYSDQLAAGLETMQEQVDAKRDDAQYDSVKAQQVVDEMVKRHDSLMNPKSNALSTALTSFGFVFHLGLSPASALVNLTQTAFVAYPLMGAKWGFVKASEALLRASRQAASNRNDIRRALQGDELRAFEEAVRSGTIDVTQAHDLAGLAAGEDAKIHWKLRPVMRAASFMFHHAEKFNRQVTFVAAYRLARAAGAVHEDAYAQAVQSTYDGHFNYAISNRPRIMQGNAAKVILLFKQYSQNMIYTLGRQLAVSLAAVPSAERTQARKALAGLLTMHAAGAGVLGLPLVTTLLALASLIGGDDDEPWDAQVALRNMLADVFGQKPGEVLAHGLSRLTPWDISGRVGLDSLIFPHVQEGLEGARKAESFMAGLLGPVAGIAVNAVKAYDEIANKSQWARGLEDLAPAAVRGPLRGYRYATEGAIDKTGVPIKDDVDTAGWMGQFAGLSPSSVREATEARSAIYQADSRLMERRQALLTQFALATLAGDREGQVDARNSISAFNRKNPTRAIRPENMMQSVRARQRRIASAQGGVALPARRRDAMEAGRFGAQAP